MNLTIIIILFNFLLFNSNLKATLLSLNQLLHIHIKWFMVTIYDLSIRFACFKCYPISSWVQQITSITSVIAKCYSHTSRVFCTIYYIFISELLRHSFYTLWFYFIYNGHYWVSNLFEKFPTTTCSRSVALPAIFLSKHQILSYVTKR